MSNEHADVTSITVSIHALVIGNKYMTLNVYRQIPRRGHLAVAWGWLNRCPEAGCYRCAESTWDGKGRHVIGLDEDGCLAQAIERADRHGQFSDIPQLYIVT